VETADDTNDEMHDEAESLATRLCDEAADQTGNRTYNQDDERGVEVHDLFITGLIPSAREKVDAISLENLWVGKALAILHLRLVRALGR